MMLYNIQLFVKELAPFKKTDIEKWIINQNEAIFYMITFIQKQGTKK